MGIFRGRRAWQQPKVCYIQPGLTVNLQKPAKQVKKEARKGVLADTAETVCKADSQEQTANKV